jgi:hypothetical protein
MDNDLKEIADNFEENDVEGAKVVLLAKICQAIRDLKTEAKP